MAKPSLMGALASQDPPDSAPADGDDAATKDPGVQAAQSVLDAVQDGDAESLYDALCSLIDMHTSKSSDGGMGAPEPKPKLVIAFGGHGPSK
jgi:hypothetical protein